MDGRWWTQWPDWNFSLRNFDIIAKYANSQLMKIQCEIPKRIANDKRSGQLQIIMIEMHKTSNNKWCQQCKCSLASGVELHLLDPKGRVVYTMPDTPSLTSATLLGRKTVGSNIHRWRAREEPSLTVLIDYLILVVCTNMTHFWRISGVLEKKSTAKGKYALPSVRTDNLGQVV
jgi:hypothetical protein